MGAGMIGLGLGFGLTTVGAVATTLPGAVIDGTPASVVETTPVTPESGGFVATLKATVADLAGSPDGLMHQYRAAGTDRSWALSTLTPGKARVYFSPDGVASSTVDSADLSTFGLSSGQPITWELSMFPDGAGDTDATLRASDDDGGTWQTLVAHTFTGLLHPTTAPVALGARYVTSGDTQSEVMTGAVHSFTFADYDDGRVRAIWGPSLTEGDMLLASARRYWWWEDWDGSTDWTDRNVNAAAAPLGGVTKSNGVVFDGIDGRFLLDAGATPAVTSTTGAESLVMLLSHADTNNLRRFWSAESSVNQGAWVGTATSAGNIRALADGDGTLAIRQVAADLSTPEILAVTFDSGTLGLRTGTTDHGTDGYETNTTLPFGSPPSLGAAAYLAGTGSPGNCAAMTVLAVAHFDRAVDATDMATLRDHWIGS